MSAPDGSPDPPLVPNEPPARGPLRARLTLILLLVVVFGAPLVVGTSWLSTELVGEVAGGDQPGGRIAGAVVDAEGAGIEGHTVTFELIDAEGRRSDAGTTTSGADGAFAFVVPPHQGFYRVRVGGGTWQRAIRDVSFLDRSGGEVEPRAVRLVLRAGAILELVFRRDGRVQGEGRFVLEGEYGEGLLFGLVPFSLRHEGTIEQGRLRLDGIPPMEARLHASLGGGEQLDLELEIRPGLNERTIEL